jgi:uncharacterized protein (DUF2344 family)
VKHIQSACLNQTVHFKLNEDFPHASAVRKIQEEYESYKELIKRNRTKLKIIEEKTLGDGSVVIKVKKQINDYDVGDYLN